MDKTQLFFMLLIFTIFTNLLITSFDQNAPQLTYVDTIFFVSNSFSKIEIVQYPQIPFVETSWWLEWSDVAKSLIAIANTFIAALNFIISFLITIWNILVNVIKYIVLVFGVIGVWFNNMISVGIYLMTKVPFGFILAIPYFATIGWMVLLFISTITPFLGGSE